MNLVQNIENAPDNMTVGSIARADPLAHLEANKDDQHFHAVEYLYHISDYDISISSKEDEFEQEQEVMSKRRRIVEMEREARHLREDNEREENVIESNDWGENEMKGNE